MAWGIVAPWLDPRTRSKVLSSLSFVFCFFVFLFFVFLFFCFFVFLFFCFFCSLFCPIFHLSYIQIKSYFFHVIINSQQVIILSEDIRGDLTRLLMDAEVLPTRLGGDMDCGTIFDDRSASVFIGSLEKRALFS
jgi:hypothetical protein